ncbi:MAG: type II secretion system F family protein, partial [Leptospiraceae bacterium]|nr:type II secretion system F family protein [Leptospiraceae bacterium]
MALFTYIAFNKKGKEEHGIIDANNIQAARNKLKAKGLYVRVIKEDKEKQERELFPFLTKLLYRIPRKEVGLFTQQLGTLLGAGIPLDRSLANIIEQTENQYFKKVLIEIRTSITEGESLSGSMARHPEIFPQQYPSLVSVGEKTGNYEATLIRLAELEEASEDLKSKVQVAMIYPFIMAGLSLFVTIFLLTVVIPQIQELFVQFDAKLPLITLIVIWISNALVNYWWLMILVIVASTYLFIRFKNSEEGKKKWDNFVLQIPIFGTLSRKVLISSFAR